jgi:hypothetical protein
MVDGTPQQIQAVDVWDYIRDEVLEEDDWRFAKTRVALEQRHQAPLYDWDYAYALPHDFLKLAKSGKDDPNVYFGTTYNSAYPHVIESVLLPEGLDKVTNGEFTGAATGWTLGTGWTYGSNAVSKAAGAVNTLSQIHTNMVSVPVVGETYLLQFEIVAISGGSIIPQIGGVNSYPVATIGVKYHYIVAESAASGIFFTPTDPDMTCTIDNVSCYKVTDRLALLSDYDNTDNPIYVTYIKRLTDVSKYPAKFVNALTFRLAAEIAINRTESREKYGDMMTLYKAALLEAKVWNQSLDYLSEEQGNNEWEIAGR